MPDAAVRTRELHKRYGAKDAVASLTLTLAPGEVFGFLGPNGAGKTTSLKMLLGLVPPTSGEATVLGAPIGDRRARARVGFLPEHFRFHEWLTARELLRFHGRLAGMPRRRIESRSEELLWRVDLYDSAGLALRGFSKGMLQRVGLAQALLHEPELVFLDEPTSGLDPLGRLLVRDVIAELRERGVTVFLNSHLLSEVETTCDRVAFMKQGRVVREMRLAGEDAGALQVELRLGRAGPELLAALSRHAAEVRLAPDAPGVVALRVADEGTLPALARCVVEQGGELYEMRARRPTLEQVFLEVMGDDQRPG